MYSIDGRFGGVILGTLPKSTTYRSISIKIVFLKKTKNTQSLAGAKDQISSVLSIYKKWKKGGKEERKLVEFFFIFLLLRFFIYFFLFKSYEGPDELTSYLIFFFLFSFFCLLLVFFFFLFRFLL